MLEQNSFTETLKAVAEIIRTSATVMSREEILAYFKDMQLTPEQEDLVFTYLSTPHEEEEREVSAPEEPAEALSEQEANLTPEELAKDSPVFAMYYEEVQALPVRTPEENNALYEALSAGDESVIEPILHSWLPQVLKSAGRYFGRKVNAEDVIQEGNMALFLKLKELCGSGQNVMDIQLSLMPAVDEAMKSFISAMCGEEDSEEIVAAKVNMVAEAQKTLRDTKGIEPGLDELGAYTHMSKDELSDILTMMEQARKAAEKKQA